MEGGAQGQVLRVQDSSGESMVIKKIHNPWRSERTTRLLCREFEILAFIEAAGGHSNLSAMADCFYHYRDRSLVSGGQPPGPDIYIVMIDAGPMLHNFTQPGLQISPEQARYIGGNMLLGLLFLEQAKIMHRDLKPRNIALNPETLDLTILDFGLGRDGFDAAVAAATGGAPPPLTAYVTTCYWRAPECLLESQGRMSGYTSKVDIWSFGCILAEIVTQHGHLQAVQRRPLSAREIMQPVRALRRKLTSELQIRGATDVGRVEILAPQTVALSARFLQDDTAPSVAAEGVTPGTEVVFGVNTRVLFLGPGRKLEYLRRVASIFAGPPSDEYLERFLPEEREQRRAMIACTVSRYGGHSCISEMPYFADVPKDLLKVIDSVLIYEHERRPSAFDLLSDPGSPFYIGELNVPPPPPFASCSDFETLIPSGETEGRRIACYRERLLTQIRRFAPGHGK